MVTNITMFGAFVDIGIKENGLLHVSQISDTFVENASDKLKVGQEVKVRVLEVDMERRRISLTCKSDSVPQATTPSSGIAPTRGGARPERGPQLPQQPAFKNNAFAGLKNIKL